MTKEKKTQPEELTYDPLDPRLTVLHRAGIAGLLLQIKTLERLHGDELAKEQRNQLIPDYGFKDDNSTFWVKFNESNFQSLMRERYQGVMVRREFTNKKKEKSKKVSEKAKKGKSQEDAPRWIFVEKTAKGKFRYEEIRPALNHFKVFGAPIAWQEHVRDSYWNSFFCISKSQEAFKPYQPTEPMTKANELFAALIDEKKMVELNKSLLLNSFNIDSKGTTLKIPGRSALLLHFWPLVSTFFIPLNLKLDKDKKTGERTLAKDWQLPVIVVPDVIDIEPFVEDFISYLGRLPEPKQSQYPSERIVSTPLEAPLAFFTAPRLAHSRVITPDEFGARGAEVYTFKRPARQAEVAGIFNEPLDDDILARYESLKHIRSLPYRSLRVENLLAHPPRHWADGFERLVAQYPLELFVATRPKESNERKFTPYAKDMAQSLCNTFQKEMKMKDKDPTVETLLWRITRNFIDWRARDKANLSDENFKFDGMKLKELRKRPSLSDPEVQWKGKCEKYLKAVMSITEEQFINFRSRRDPQSFANAFSETLFRAPFYLKPEETAMLRPFYEGDQWESGRRLVLMAISAAGAVATFGADEEAIIESDVTPEETNSDEEE